MPAEIVLEQDVSPKHQQMRDLRGNLKRLKSNFDRELIYSPSATSSIVIILPLANFCLDYAYIAALKEFWISN